MKIGFVSLGCPKNLVDGEVMLGLAEDAGHEITPDAASADVLVVNTCAFIDRAKQESVDAILDMARHKRDGRCTRLVVTGCLAERYRDELRQEIPEIDAVLGTGEVPRIVAAINGQEAQPLTFFGTSLKARATHSALSYIYDAETPRRLTTPRHFAYVKVAEGCDYTCSFCIIPTLRGSYRSRPAESIVREARALVERGVKELILISQDTTFYGVDRKERGALAALLRELNALDGVEWIRLLYLYPTTITPETVEAMADCEKVCRYVDLPLQHASTSVLRRMRRPGDRAVYSRLLERIRDRMPDVTLRTTFIVGFPGETRQDFDELWGFVKETGFDHLGVFTYSHEEGTRAYSVPDDVPAQVKRQRRDELMRLQRSIVETRHQARIGTRARVLVDGPSADHPLVLQGRTAGQAPEIDPVVYLTECDPSAYPPGTLIEAEITGASGYDLAARPLFQLYARAIV
ncbi:MAG TPA: 30S ribosomal protein S12 methylthiotransferase RimO [Vicinamibacterales bacterium]|jgi:ribosomal protein S12 methylthiotransferase|nr:30S ribosomal protein S12 methylthiotransferase RimO [Vicinamibacterales bacterium]